MVENAPLSPIGCFACLEEVGQLNTKDLYI